MKRLFSKKKLNHPVRRRRLDEVDLPKDQSSVGSATSYSYSYRRNVTLPNADHSPRMKVHDLKRHQQRYGLWLMGAIMAALLLTFLLYQLSGTVGVSLYGQIGSSSDQSRDIYNKKISGYFNSRPLERIRLLTNLEDMSQHLQGEGLLEVEQVLSVDPNGLGSSHFVLKMRQPVAVWVLDGQNYFVDKEGVIFTNNYFDSPKVVITDESGLSEAMSGRVLTVTSRRFLDFIGQSVGRLESYQLEVGQVVIPPNTTRMVELQLKDGGLPIRMTVDRPVGEQAEDAMRAIRYAKEEKMNLRYIDVRVSGRAFYRNR